MSNPVPRLGRRWLILVFAIWLVGGAPEVAATETAATNAAAASPNESEAAGFVARHWSRPLAAQGPLSSRLAAQGISLAPQSCATCHPQQFADWRQSLHSQAMGPGLMGQLMSMPAHARGEHQDCIRCHAPLAEQADSLVDALTALGKSPPAGSGGAAQPGSLHQQGLICTACHVRKLEWFGPPRRDGSQFAGDAGAAPHGGWTSSSGFESSQFCAACHQFKDDEYALNGKLLENTYKEWQASRHAREGRSCQSCHMPDRRHLWRGIHDPEMVKKGVEFRAEPLTTTGAPNAQLSARISLTNSGVGHYFPTYVTPQVVVRAIQQDAAGRPISATGQQFVIGRQVSMDISTEIADTRIAPDATTVFDYQAPRHRDARSVAWEVIVHPDAFYLAFYESWLRDTPRGPGRSLIVQARDSAKASPYPVFSKVLALP